MTRKTKKFKENDMIAALKYIPGVADKGDLGVFLYYNEEGLAVCDFVCSPFEDGRVDVDPKLIMKLQRRSVERVKEIRKKREEMKNNES
mgnify:CR=1 FL=1